MVFVSFAIGFFGRNTSSKSNRFSRIYLVTVLVVYMFKARIWSAWARLWDVQTWNIQMNFFVCFQCMIRSDINFLQCKKNANLIKVWNKAPLAQHLAAEIMRENTECPVRVLSPTTVLAITGRTKDKMYHFLTNSKYHQPAFPFEASHVNTLPNKPRACAYLDQASVRPQGFT